MSRSDLILLLALGLVFTPLEWLWPIRRTPVDWARMRTDVLHVFVSGTVIRVGVGLAVAGLALLSAHAVPAGLSAAGPRPARLAAVHRDPAARGRRLLCLPSPQPRRAGAVAVPPGAPLSEKLDWIAGNRVHPVDQILLAVAYTAPSVLLGFSPEPLLVYALLYRWHAELLHSNLRISFGPLKWLIASPPVPSLAPRR